MRGSHSTCASFSSRAWSFGTRFKGMTASRIALVTGANQGLGRALVEGLAARMAPQDRILLPGRDQLRVPPAAEAVGVEGRVLDIRDGSAIEALAAYLGEIDIVFSN